MTLFTQKKKNQSFLTKTKKRYIRPHLEKKIGRQENLFSGNFHTLGRVNSSLIPISKKNFLKIYLLKHRGVGFRETLGTPAKNLGWPVFSNANIGLKTPKLQDSLIVLDLRHY